MNRFKQVIAGPDKDKRDLFGAKIPYKSPQPGKTAKRFLGSSAREKRAPDIDGIDDLDFTLRLGRLGHEWNSQQKQARGAKQTEFP